MGQVFILHTRIIVVKNEDLTPVCSVAKSGMITKCPPDQHA